MLNVTATNREVSSLEEQIDFEDSPSTIIPLVSIKLPFQRDYCACVLSKSWKEFIEMIRQEKREYEELAEREAVQKRSKHRHRVLKLERVFRESSEQDLAFDRQKFQEKGHYSRHVCRQILLDKKR